MNEEKLNEILQNFNANEWINDYNANSHVFKKDFNLIIELGQGTERQDDQSFSGSVWDDFFSKFSNNEIVEIIFKYNGLVIKSITMAVNSDIVVPIPVGANMIENFYDWEFELARMLSNDKNYFNTLLNIAKLQKKLY